jgi:hypothetical protein
MTHHRPSRYTDRGFESSHYQQRKSLPYHSQNGISYSYPQSIYYPSGGRQNDRSFTSSSSYNYGKRKQVPHVTKDSIFNLLRNYGNNLYSILVTEKDLQCNEVTPHVQKEMMHIRKSLIRPQINLANISILRSQQSIVDQAILAVVRENLKLSLETYRQYSNEIDEKIHAQINPRLRYVPTSTRIFNYIKPKLSTNRFSSEILPQVQQKLEEFISALNNKLVNVRTVSTTQIPMDTQVSMNNLDPVGFRTMVDGSTQTDNFNKRKQNITFSDNDTSIEAVLIDSDQSRSEPAIVTANFAKLHRQEEVNTVHTVQEAFTNYQTVVPCKTPIPQCKKPPTNPPIYELSVPANPDLLHTITDVDLSLTPAYGFITLFTQNCIELPPSHIAIRIHPSSISDDHLSQIPPGGNYVYELLLIGKSYGDYKTIIPIFIEWCQRRNAPFFITGPSANIPDIKEQLSCLSPKEIPRPFQVEASSSLIG